MKYCEGLILCFILIVQVDINYSQSDVAQPLNSARDDLPILDTSYDRVTNIPVPNTLNNKICPDGYECAPLLSCTFKLEPDDLPSGNNSNTLRKCPGDSEVCCYKTLQNETVPLMDSRSSTGNSQCGIRNVEISRRISSHPDDYTNFAEFPWMVTLLLKNYTADGQSFNIYQGGGSLIHPSVVLTAAHRVQGYSTNVLRVRAGVWDTTAQMNLLPHQDRDVAQVVVHDNYHAASLHNDVALVFLVSPFILGDNIRPICLPPADFVADYRRCISTGWGKDAFTVNATYSNLLKKVDLPIVPSSECQSILRSTRLGKYFELHNSFICAGGEVGKDSCNGDGGSPLICSTGSPRNQFYQVGIVAWGIGCGDDNLPGVYSNVAKFRGWIDKIVTEIGLTIDSYNTT